VAVISDSFARRYFGDAAKAIGRQITIGRGPTAITHEIVGVARDVRDRNLRTAPDRLAYLPWFQDRVVRLAPFEFLIATTQDPTRAVAATRRAIERLHPDAPITKIETMPEVIGGRLRSERLLATLGTAFAVIALVLAAVGMHGLLAYVVARRVPEFGVRLALGARPVELLWLTLRDNVMLVATGAGVGIIGAVAGLRVVDGLLFGLSPTDGTTLTIAALVLMAASIAGAAVPARRAAMVDPLVALRAE
jgi:ABC-type antimicrobial peptide transport system permease subunit